MATMRCDPSQNAPSYALRDDKPRRRLIGQCRLPKDCKFLPVGRLSIAECEPCPRRFQVDGRCADQRMRQLPAWWSYENGTWGADEKVGAWEALCCFEGAKTDVFDDIPLSIPSLASAKSRSGHAGRPPNREMAKSIDGLGLLKVAGAGFEPTTSRL